MDTVPAVRVLYERVRARVLARRRAPLATYRVQLHQQFGFDDARALVPYLKALGVTDLYSSPYLRALPGSNHGYDVVDHARLNPEIGSPEAHAALCAALAEAGMGHVLDVVPNHMGIERDNPLWTDVLENGPASIYARFFDIDWDPVKPELRDKVLLPILGDQYGVVLERGELQLAYADGAFTVGYFDRRFPVAPRAYAALLGHRLPELERELGPTDPAVIELQSILTALTHLPSRTDADEARRIERNREKEVIKRRLAQLVTTSPPVAAFVAANVALFNGDPKDPRSFDRLDAVLQACPYRLAHWRVAGEEINYRRFFDINGLAAIRVEDPDVFAEAHALVFRFLRQGQVSGLRIDHPDGLFDPTAYFLDLQERYFLEHAAAVHAEDVAQTGLIAGDDDLWPELRQALRALWRKEVLDAPDSPLRKALYVVVEKIQGGRERIPEAWAIAGTVGYRFANMVTGLFVDRAQEHALTDLYARFIGERQDFRALVQEKKRLILKVALSSELNVLAHALNRISELNRRTRDFTLNALRAALLDFIALFPVYRTYVDGWREIDARDVQYIEWTLARCRERNPTTNATIWDFLGDVLLGRCPACAGESERAERLRFTMKLQQVSGPVMAKGLEDTVFYLYNRLTALNEVGGEPERFGATLPVFHLRNQERAERWPTALLTSTTHDTKRSEDVRARISVLSELPGEWRTRLRRWARLNKRHKANLDDRLAPDANDEYLFYQTILGAWPMEGALDEAGFSSFRERLREYMLKAIKEAKVNTSWVNPEPRYEAATAHFVDAALDPARSAAFLEDLLAFQRTLVRPGQLNALSQLLLKLTSPGTPDTYQGCELWALTLVDPDNRRPVDFALRQRLLAELDAQAGDRAALCDALTASMNDGRIKLYVTAEGLRFRRRSPALFERGDYQPLDVSGPREAHAVAFARTCEARALVAVAPRLTVPLLAGPDGLAAAMKGTVVRLPDALADATFQDVFTGRTVRPEQRAEGAVLDVGGLLGRFPLALLERV